MFALSELVGAWTGSNRVAELAERVAGRSRLAVWQRVASQVPQLGPGEARGYVRARAGGVIQEETERLATQEGSLVKRWQARIEAAALEQLTSSMLAQLQQPRLAIQRRAA
jgi:hypothetical protein